MMSKPVTSTALGRKILSCSQFGDDLAALVPDRAVARPAQGGERPQRGGEPGVEHVVVLAQRADRRLRGAGARIGLVLADEDVAGLVVPGRDAVAPPQLAADAPVLDVVQPLRVGGGPVLRHELDLARTHRIQRRLGDRLAAAGAAVLSVSEVRSTNHWSVSIGSITASERSLTGTCSLCGLVSTSRPAASRSASTCLARVVAVQAAVLLRRVVVDLGVQREDGDRRQLVPLADGVVVEVVRRGDLHAAGAEILVDVVVGDHRNGAAGQRQVQLLADQVARSARPPDAPPRRRRPAWFPGGWWRPPRSRRRRRVM